MLRVGEIPPALRSRSRLLANQLFGVEFGLRQLGMKQDRFPVDPGGGWIDHLRWGMDSMVACLRFLAAGQVVGAAQISRSQLERWSLNLENASGIRREHGERTSAFYDRLWACVEQGGLELVPEAERQSSRRVSVDGRGIYPGKLYDDLSDFLHGQGPGAAAAFHEAGKLLRPPGESEALLSVGHSILDAVELVIERIRVCVGVTFAQVGADPELFVRFQVMSSMTDPAGMRPFPSWSLWPLNLTTGLSEYATSRFAIHRELADGVLRGERPAGRLFHDDEISEIFFVARRERSATHALIAFEEERRIVGNDFNADVLHGRESRLILVAEVLGLISCWSGSNANVRHASAMASSALRSAFWLWLEDDDRAMGVLRVALESLARLHTWARNQNRAAKLEGRSKTTPRDWLDAAGWRRLEVLNLALGELAHLRSNPRWSGARLILVQLMDPEVEAEFAPFRARGFALESVLLLAAQVAVEALPQFSPTVADAVRGHMENMGVFSVDVSQRLEEWLTRCWNSRGLALGEGDLREPTPEEHFSEMERIRKNMFDIRPSR